MLFTQTDQALGEIPHMSYVERFQVADVPPEGPSIPLSRLSSALEDMGLCLSLDAQGYLESYTTYQMEPEQDPDADWRLDISVGSTCCTPLINDYLSAAADFFQNSSLSWASFHTFRRDVGTVRLLSRDDEPPEVHPETGSLLSPEDIATLESFSGDSRGYFGRMLDFLQNFMDAGVQAGRFTKRQARRDLQIALWYAYACNNMDEYRFYYQAAQWMPDSEENAKGCATWYYRYSAALMYCGRLKEAQKYAELGA